MGLPYRLVMRPAMRFIDSESAHQISLRVLTSMGQSRSSQKLLGAMYRTPSLPITVFGRLFRHPLGLAAGFDKSAAALESWPALGFSWSEYGGITRYPQEGNPKPRMFRSDSDAALINRMGFNNPGASAVRDSLIARRAAGRWPETPVAANIGRSKNVDNDRAPQDYSETMDILYDVADFFVLNISSPNTPDLLELQTAEHVREVVRSCDRVRDRKGGAKRLLLKLSPDLDDEILLSCVGAALSVGIDGFVASNSTISRPPPSNTRSRRFLAESGGLSGRPLHQRSVEMIGLIYDSVGDRVPIVGCGGIESGATAWNAITNGSSLIQLYSAMVFHGPSVVSKIVKDLRKRVDAERFQDLDEAVGYARN